MALKQPGGMLWKRVVLEDNEYCYTFINVGKFSLWME